MINWQQLVEEFGDRAFECVRIETMPKWFVDPTNNHQVDLAIDIGAKVELKPIEQLIQHDIEWYGDNAYLFWHVDYCEKMPSCNDDILTELKYSPASLVRKQSAALPFDLERAKAGDVVEYFNGEYWVTIDANYFEQHGVIYVSIQNDEFVVYRKDLRMKYPPRIKQ